MSNEEQTGEPDEDKHKKKRLKPNSEIVGVEF